MKVNALEWFNNIKESNMSLGLSKKVSKNYEKNREDNERDFHDAISDDLMNVQDFFKEIDNVIEPYIESMSDAQELVYLKTGRNCRGLSIEKYAEDDELKGTMSMYIKNFDSNFKSLENAISICIVIENSVGYVNPRRWAITRKWRRFDMFFNDFVSVDLSETRDYAEFFKTTSRSLVQIKDFFKLFAFNYQDIWESTIDKVAKEGGINALNSLKSGNIKKLVGDVLIDIKKREEI